jgi:hypothetical protein
MAMKDRTPLALYRAGPQITPAAQIDAAVLEAARASLPAARRPPILIFAAATAAAVVALFYARIATTPTQNPASTEFGREEGLTRAWLANLDLDTPTGPGSQEGLP